MAELTEYIASRGGQILEVLGLGAEEPPVRFRIRCSSGHIWEPRVADLLRSKSWCPECMHAKTYTIEDLRRWAENMGGRCLSDVYTGTGSRYRWECGLCSNIWDATWGNVENHLSWCPECKSSLREIVVRAAFEENLPDYKFPKDRSEIGMELDGYCPELRLAFEHDGIQHAQRVPHFQRNEGDFEAQRARDAVKDTLCEDRWITLVRIPGRDALPLRQIRTRVRGELETLGYNVAVRGELPSEEDFFGAIQAVRGRKDNDKYLIAIREQLEKSGEVLITDVCPSRTWPLQVRCRRDHVYQTHMDNIVRGRGCPQCSQTREKTNSELEEASRARGYDLLYNEHRHDADWRSRLFLTLQCPNNHDPFEMSWDNFRAGKGCTPCGRGRTGQTKRCAPAEIAPRLTKMGLRLEGEYQTLTKPTVFRCEEKGHTFTCTIKKAEMMSASGPSACYACILDSYPGLYNVKCLTAWTPETDPVKTLLEWECNICKRIFRTGFRGMQIRRYKCSSCR